MPVRDLLSAASTQGALPSDPNFEYNTLLLNGDGTNGAQNNTFLDSSTNNFTITRNGNTTQGSFSPYGPNWSSYFGDSGTSGNVITTTLGAGGAFGTADFTVECWAYMFYNLGSGANPYIIDTRTNTAWSFSWNYNGGSDATQLSWANASGTVLQTSTPMPLNQWNHCAYVRASGVGTIYLNGVSVASYTDTTDYATNVTTAYIGKRYSGNSTIPGYLSNFRIVKGTAVYTTAFTPPTVPLTAVSGTQLLTFQSNRFIDNSSNNLALTITGNISIQRFSPFNPTATYDPAVIGGSGYFDGSGDNLTPSGADTACAMGLGDWTVEAWIYLTVSGGTPFVFDTLPSGSGATTGLRLRLNSSNQAQLWQYASAVLTSSTAVAINGWTHVAFVRNTITTTVYINGTASGTYTDLGNYTCGTNRPMIGSDGYDSGNSSSFTGYITNLRFVKGTAVYTSSFTPPTAPLTAITNTSLLTNMVNAGIPDLAMMNNLQTVGNAQVSTSVKKYGTGSLSFNGTNSGLSSPSIPTTAFGTGDFTVEAWVNFNANLPYLDGDGLYAACLFGQATTNGLCLIFRSATSSAPTQLNFVVFGVGNVATGLSMSLNTWYHIAVVRQNGTVYIYLNGVSQGSFASVTNFATSVSTIGYLNVGGFYDYFSGNIDDFRITKGYARYPSGTTFTPPTAALPTF